MAKIVGRNASLYLEDNLGASKALSGLTNNVTLRYNTNAVETTGFGDDNRLFLINGIKDWELTFDVYIAVEANETDAVLFGIVSGSTAFKFGPNGSAACQIAYGACGVLTNYEMTYGVEGAGTATGTITARAGSLTRIQSASKWAALESA